jgi:DNA modification methylase
MQTEHRIVIGSSQRMPELANCSVHLMVTSPPYPMIKMWDYQFSKLDAKIEALWKELGTEYREETVTKIYDVMHENLARVWQETYRVLVDGGIACINIGDATRSVNSSFRLFPNHARIIENCERAGFTTLPYILWKKPTTKPKYKGKGAFLGSGFLPPNAYVTLDCEFILLFRKGSLRKFPRNDNIRHDSKFTKKQRDAWFTQIWTLKGTRQTRDEVERRTAAFPEEIADRLIRMFSVKGDLVLDPFLGSGTTIKAAMQNDRSSFGYEIDESLIPLIKATTILNEASSKVTIVTREPA